MKYLGLLLIFSSSLAAQPFHWTPEQCVQFVNLIGSLSKNIELQFKVLSANPEASIACGLIVKGTGSITLSDSATNPAVGPLTNFAFNAGSPSSFRSESAAAIRPEITAAQPAPPPDPLLIFLDGLGSGLIGVDMTTLSVVSQVAVPSVTGPFGIRPGTAGNEVWVTDFGTQVSVVDQSTQTLVTNIPTPTVSQSLSEVPQVGIVFTPDGATAFEAVKYYSPDSLGNNGALLTFDAVHQTVTSTMPLKLQPAALLIAPDGLTVYILTSSGTITYYDVLSGTADLSLSTFPAGSDAGYPGSSSNVFIHPDGTRLFWNVGVYLTVFDLNSHTVTNQFNSGLPTTVGRTFTLSPDGSRAYFSDPLGDVAVLDTLSGSVLTTFNTGAGTTVLEGAPVAP